MKTLEADIVSGKFSEKKPKPNRVSASFSNDWLS